MELLLELMMISLQLSMLQLYLLQASLTALQPVLCIPLHPILVIQLQCLALLQLVQGRYLIVSIVQLLLQVSCADLCFHVLVVTRVKLAL